MSQGKNIEIKIAASGGGQASAEMQKAEKSIREINTALDKLAENDFSEENQTQIQALTANLKQAKERYRELAAEAEQASEQQETFAQKSNIAGAAMIGAGIGGAVVSKVFSEIAQGIASIDVEKLREMDAAMAEQVETARGWAEVLSDPVNGIQRLISGNTIGEAFGDVNTQLGLNAQMQAEAIDRIIQNGRKTAAEMKALAQEIAAANAILAAKDAADAKGRDAQDAERIRNGEAPEDVRSARAAYDRDKEIEAIDRGLEPKAATTQTLFDDARQAVINEERVKQDPRATREDVAKAVKEAEDARKAADAAKKEYDAAAAVAAEQRRGVRTEFDATVADAGYDKSQRLASEKKKADDQAAREAAKVEAEQKRDDAKKTREEKQRLQSQLEAGEGALNDDARNRGLGVRRSGLGQSRGVGAGNDTVAAVGKALQDGTDAAELQKLGDMVREKQRENGAAITAALMQMITELQAQSKQMEIIKNQIKNMRTPGR
jgi:hypothetical protein